MPLLFDENGEANEVGNGTVLVTCYMAKGVKWVIDSNDGDVSC
jgi:hypothetical protein